MSDNDKVISDEAVEAAAKAIFESRGSNKWDSASGMWSGAKESTRKEARAALEAAAPYIAASALEGAADEFEDLPANKGAEISSGTWDWFELFPIHHIRDRAANIRTPTRIGARREHQ